MIPSLMKIIKERFVRSKKVLP